MYISNNVFFQFLKFKNLINKFYKKNIIILKILQIKKKFIILEGGFKSEIFISFRNLDNQDKKLIKKGFFLETLISDFENKYGGISIRRNVFKNYVFWKNIIYKYKNKKIIKGIVSSKVKGGYSINIEDHRSFLPFSCADKKINNSYYLGKKLYFIIFNININKKNVILSRKIFIKKVLKLKKKIFFKKIKIGYILKGLVKNINNYCLFVDTGYTDCIIFYKNIFWGNYKHLGEFFKVGQSILGIILKIDKNKFRIFLGVKQLFNIWKAISKTTNCVKYVRILKLTSNYIYVILGSNMISQISIYRKNSKYFAVNGYKKILIRNYNFKKKKINFKFISPPLA